MSLQIKLTYNPLSKAFWTTENLLSKKEKLRELKHELICITSNKIDFDEVVNGKNDWVHPSVIYFENGWNDHKYWMGINAYPGTQGKWENPYFFYSDNGTTWHTPNGLIQPLYGIDRDMLHNSDAAIFMDYDGVTMHYINRAVFSTKETTSLIEGISSKDGVNWTERKTIFSGPLPDYLSPSVCLADGKYYMFGIAPKDILNGERDYKSIAVLEAEEVYGDWKEINRISTGQLGELWHGEVQYINGRFIILGTTGSADGGRLVIGKFNNVTDERVGEEIRVTRGKANYKSTFIVENNIMQVFAGLKSPGLGLNTKWHVIKLRRRIKL